MNMEFCCCNLCKWIPKLINATGTVEYDSNEEKQKPLAKQESGEHAYLHREQIHTWQNFIFSKIFSFLVIFFISKENWEQRMR